MGYPPPSVFFCISHHFNFFSGVELKLCPLSGRKYKNLEIIVICKDVNVVSVDMQACMDALIVVVLK